jgi:hypothetical protein
MDFINSHLRFQNKIPNGEICVCKLKDGCNWNQTGVVLGVYYDGQFYDSQVKESNMLDSEQWGLWYEDGESCVEEYAPTGVNVEDLISPVLD